MDFAKILELGGTVTLIGVGMVFVILGILIGFVVLLDMFFKGKSNEKSDLNAENVVVATPTPVVVSENNDAVIAAIFASIYATLSSENTGVVPNFRIISFKEIRRKR